MSKKEIIKGNKLIAEFMGLKPFDTGKFGFAISKDHCSCNEATAEKAMDGFVSMAKYAFDWNWLMPVWEKIMLSEDPYMITGVIKPNYCHITVLNVTVIPDISRISNISTIDAIWLTIIDYISWYNFKNLIK